MKDFCPSLWTHRSPSTSKGKRAKNLRRQNVKDVLNITGLPWNRENGGRNTWK